MVHNTSTIIRLRGGSDFRGLQNLATTVTHVLDDVIVQQQLGGVVLNLDGSTGFEKLLIRRKERNRRIEAVHLSVREKKNRKRRNGDGHHGKIRPGAVNAVLVQQSHIEEGDFDRRRRRGKGGFV